MSYRDDLPDDATRERYDEAIAAAARVLGYGGSRSHLKAP
jgi:hypothetical protein